MNDRFSFSFQREVWYKFVLDFEYFHNTGNEPSLRCGFEHGGSELFV